MSKSRCQVKSTGTGGTGTVTLEPQQLFFFYFGYVVEEVAVDDIPR